MLNKKIILELTEQANIEYKAFITYLNMASWVEFKGFHGICNFLYDHSNEEREHMLKLMRYINKRGGYAVLDNKFNIKKYDYNSLQELFKILLDHEIEISKRINILVNISLNEKDYATHNFLQWFVKEQVEEEYIIKTILDYIKLLKYEKIGLYFLDKEIINICKKRLKNEN